MGEDFGEGGDIAFALFVGSHEVVGYSGDEIGVYSLKPVLRLPGNLLLNFIALGSLLRGPQLLLPPLELHLLRRHKGNALIDPPNKFLRLNFLLIVSRGTWR